MTEEKKEPIRMTSQAFGNHMRRKADHFKPECLNIGPDFAVFEFVTTAQANQFVMECLDFNGMYNYTIQTCSGAKTQNAAQLVVIINPFSAEEEKATNG